MPAPLETALHLFHFGLLVLIWLVQLVIYPSLAYVAVDRFRDWHKSYTERVSLVVVPLMFGQLGLVTLRILCEFMGWSGLFGTLDARDASDAAAAGDAVQMASVLVWIQVLACWLATFLISVPIHSRLQEYGHSESLIQQLVLTNWIRTGLWTGIFLLDFLY